MIFSIELVAHKNKCTRRRWLKVQVFFNRSCQPHELLAYDTTFFLDFLKLNAYLHVLLHYSHMSSRDVWGIFYELVSRVLMTRLDWQWMLSTCVWIDMPTKIWKKICFIFLWHGCYFFLKLDTYNFLEFSATEEPILGTCREIRIYIPCW